MSSYQEKKEKLEAIRKNSSTVRETAKSLRRVTTRSPFAAPVEAVRLGVKLRKAAKKHEDSAWLIAFVIALSCDGLDLIPVAGWIITWFFRPLLFIFLFGRGTWKLRLAIYLLLLLDFFPILNLIPISTACVYYAYHKSKKEYLLANDYEKEIAKTQNAYA